MLGGAIAQTRKGLHRLIKDPVAAEDVDRVDRSCADRVGDLEELVLAETKDVLGVVLGWDHDVSSPREPPPHRVELCDGQSVVIEHRSEVLVPKPLVTRRLVVTAPERHAREATLACGSKAVSKRDAPLERAGAQDEVTGLEAHRLVPRRDVDRAEERLTGDIAAHVLREQLERTTGRDW